MKIIKKDFVDEKTVSYCAKGHKLSSGTAYYMQAEDGTIYYGGKQCAKLHGANDLKDVPDLTKSLVALSAIKHSEGSGGGSIFTHDKRKSLAIAYLLLREEVLIDFTLNGKSLSYKTLSEYHAQYKATGNITENQVTHILNIEKSSVKKFYKKLSLKNLSTCHAFKFILNRTTAHLVKKEKIEGVNFINSLNQYLLTHCSLTPKQVEGLGKWVQYLPVDLRNAKLKGFE